jgi:putative flippase GtrA
VSAIALFDRLPRFVRFLACGGFAAAVNWASRFAWNLIMPFSLAVLAAYVTGMVVAFILFREFVFECSSSDTSEQVRNFVIVNIVGMAATWALANLLVYWALPAAGVTSHVEAIGHGIAIFAPVVTSWFGHRFLTFR